MSDHDPTKQEYEFTLRIWHISMEVSTLILVILTMVTAHAISMKLGIDSPYSFLIGVLTAFICSTARNKSLYGWKKYNDSLIERLYPQEKEESEDVQQ